MVASNNKSQTTIDALLARQKVRRIQSSLTEKDARQWLKAAQHLAANYPAFDRLRLSLLDPESHPFQATDQAVCAIATWLVQNAWLVKTANGGFAFSKANKEARPFLAGLWLEGYVCCAVMEAGADEAYFGQKVEWMVDDVRGRNEIDVLARKGDRLILVSCKSVKSRPDTGRSGELRDYLFETHYWNLHFAKGTGLALLVTTADLIDEQPPTEIERFPPVGKQAGILNVALVGGESLPWDTLVKRLRQRFDTWV